MQLPPYRPRRRESFRELNSQSPPDSYLNRSCSRVSSMNIQSNDMRLSQRSSLNTSNFSTNRSDGGYRPSGTSSYRSRSLDNFRSTMMNPEPQFVGGGIHTLERANHRSKGADDRYNNQDVFSMTVAEESLDRWRMGFRDIPALASPARGESGYISPRSRTSYTMSTGDNLSFGCEFRHGHRDNTTANSTRNTSTTRRRVAEPSPGPASLSPGTNWSYNNSEDVTELRSIISKLVSFNRQLRSIIKQSLENHSSLNLCQRCREDLRMVTSASVGPPSTLKKTLSDQHKSMTADPVLLRNNHQSINNASSDRNTDCTTHMTNQPPLSSRHLPSQSNHPCLPMPPRSARLGRVSPRIHTARSSARSNYKQDDNMENITPDRFKTVGESGPASAAAPDQLAARPDTDYVPKYSTYYNQHGGDSSDRYGGYNQSPQIKAGAKSNNNNTAPNVDRNNFSNSSSNGRSSTTSHPYTHWKDRLAPQLQQRLTYASNHQSDHVAQLSDRMSRSRESKVHPLITAPKSSLIEHQDDRNNNSNLTLPPAQLSSRYSTTTQKTAKAPTGYVIPALRLDVVGKGKWLTGELTHGDTYD